MVVKTNARMMKRIIVTRTDPYLSTMVQTNDKNSVIFANESLGVKFGDNFADFYHKNKNNYSFNKIPENKTLTLQETIRQMSDKNPALSLIIETFELQT